MEANAELDRLINLAQQVLRRLDGDECLSSVLPQVGSLLIMQRDTMGAALIDILVHGLTKLPYQGVPFTDPAYKQAGLIHSNLCAMEDVSKIDLDEVLNDPWVERIPNRDTVVVLSVFEMENVKPAPTAGSRGSPEMTNQILQLQVYHDRVKSILSSLRGFVYRKVSRLWIQLTREKDRIDLLGMEYRFVTDRLNVVETAVGDELLAAVDNLRSTNPASWNACALVCRNVVLKLAKILWKPHVETYVTVDGEQLQVSGDREKNMLLSYIDVYCRQGTPDDEAADEARALVHSIYGEGSKGKHQIRREEAKRLVVDTFRLVELLDAATELTPVLTLPETAS